MMQYLKGDYSNPTPDLHIVTSVPFNSLPSEILEKISPNPFPNLQIQFVGYFSMDPIEFKR